VLQAKASRISADAAMPMARSSGNRTIASMRIKWVEELRQALSEYHSILMTVDRKFTEGPETISEPWDEARFDAELNEPDQALLTSILNSALLSVLCRP
jgi:predicted metal-binding protein